MVGKQLIENVIKQIGTKVKTDYVHKEAGKGLSTEDYTTGEKTKLSNIEANAEVNIIEDVKVNGTSMQVTNKAVDIPVPTKVSDITNDSGFIDNTVNNLVNYTKTGDMNTAISNAVGTETINRQNADNNLQNQIDAITSASDVVDIVGTYTELQNYDTSSLTDDDVIKVLQDSTHNNALSYYRWVITNNVGAWSYVGSEGPFYTKGETDTLLNAKYNKPSGGIPKTDLASGIQTSLDKADSALQEHQDITGKENISNKVTTIDDESTDTQYPSAKCVYDRIAELEEENALLRKDIAGLPTATATGESIDIADSAEMRLEKLQIGGNTKQTQYSGKNLFDYDGLINADIVTISGNAKNFTLRAKNIGQYYFELNNIKENTSYKITGRYSTGRDDGEVRIVYDDNTSFNVIGKWSQETITNEEINITTDATKTITKIRFDLYVNSNFTINDFMISEVGGDFEPYCRTDKLALTQTIYKR